MSDSGLFIEDLPETVTSRPARTATIQAQGGEGPTTLAVSEEGDEPVTTLAVGEEGEYGDDPTTEAVGEEGDEGS